MFTSTKWVIAVFTLLVLAGGGFLGFLWYQSRATSGLALEVSTPDQVRLGIPFEATVTVNNDSRTILQDSTVSLEIPEGMVFLGESSGKTLEYKTVGSIGVGSINEETFKLMVVDGTNSVKRVKAALSYTPASLGAKFEIEKQLDINVGDAGLKLDIELPEKVLSGEDFETHITYENVSDGDYSNMELTVDYPPTFNFIKATLNPDSGNRQWDLGDLHKASKNDFKITGNLSGPDNATFDLMVKVAAEFNGQKYTIATQKATVTVAPSPVTLRVQLNDSQDAVVAPNDLVVYTIFYANNTNLGLRDVVITAKLAGEMFNFTELSSNAAFNPNTNTLTWNAANTADLALLGSGGSGSVRAQLRLKPTYPIKRLGDKNFLLKINAQIESPTVPYGVSSTKTVSVAKLESKVIGATVIDQKAFFRDAASGMVNTGAWPPKVGKPSRFTIHWDVTNYATDVSNVEVRGFFGPNVRFTGAVKSNTGRVPTYNERTQEMVWMIDKITATKGVISSPTQAIFQVEVIPSQAGGYAQLTQDVTLKANDDFVGKPLQSGDAGLNTNLIDDPTVTSQQGLVQ